MAILQANKNKQKLIPNLAENGQKIILSAKFDIVITFSTSRAC